MSLTLRLKAAVVGSPLDALAHHIRWIIKFPERRRNPELWEIYFEEKRSTEVLRKLLKPDSNVVDVGCHIGSFLSLVEKLCPEGHHTAIEASPQKGAWLKAKFPRADVHNVAVGRENGTAFFFENLNRPGYSRLHHTTPDRCVKHSVTVRTLDELLSDKKRIDLIKLDIEGGELDAFRGAGSILAKHTPVLYFECGSNDDLKSISVSRGDIFDLLTSYDYQIFTLLDFLYQKGPLPFDEFRKCGIYPFRAFNFLALPNAC